MNLSSVFAGIAHKQLVAVDLPEVWSNQHELNGVSSLREFLGTRGETRGTLNWHYFADDIEPVQEIGSFTFYDARAKSADRTRRSEWRFYYSGSFLSRADIGDWFILAQSRQGDLFALVFQNNSAWLRAAQALFGIEASGRIFDTLSSEALREKRLDLLQRQIIFELGIELSVPAEPNDEELMLREFGKTLPTTKEMSAFARAQVEVDLSDPDDALVRWLDREERLFRALENVIVGEKLAEGFTSVDDFIAYSLSVQNKRKSRMGYALQNHLEEVFTQSRVEFSPQARTEGKTKADFIFPGERQYQDADFDATLLVLLGAKSTSKDRWRQVLDEADRIPNKHLCTLEAGISTDQTDAMRRRSLTLVIPAQLQFTYTAAQRQEILTLNAFIDLVRQKQR